MLEFNVRVLLRQKKTDLPLLERLNYLCISCSNLDEFYEVRVASLLEMAIIDPDKKGADGLTPAQQLEQIDVKAHQLVAEQYRVLNEILIPQLQEENIHFVRRDYWTAETTRMAGRLF
jgi:polyphosphate kinase